MAKRKVSAQTRVKISQASKKRRRAPKGTPYAGQFLSGVSYSAKSRAGLSRAMGGETPGGLPPRFQRSKPLEERKHVSSSETRERASINKQQIDSELRDAGVRSGIKREKLSNRFAADRTERQTGEMPTYDDLAGGSARVGRVEKREVDRRLRDSRWKKEAVYGGDSTWKDKNDKGKILPPRQFIEREMAPSHKAWVDEQLNDPASVFNAGQQFSEKTRGKTTSAGARNRLERYTTHLQQGYSHNEALLMVQRGRQGRSIKAGGRTAAKGARQRKEDPQGRESKFESFAPKPNEFSFGVEASLPRPIEQIKEKIPGLTDQDYVRIQDAERRSYSDEITKNVRWAQESRRAQILGDQQNKYDANPDKVTFFTTNLGGPSLTVPSDSAIGQYVIRQRKKMLVKDRVVPAGRLRGEFPQAVRDQHLIEFRTGLGFHVQGRAGIAQESGVRVRNFKSRGYMRPTPVGASVLTDSQGRPIYDSKGNIRYSEGTSRAFDTGTDKIRGLRVFIG